MKTFGVRNLIRVRWFLSGLALCGTTLIAQTWNWTIVSIKPSFVIRSYGGKCLDFGPPPQLAGSPVFIYDCNGTVAQDVQIEEVNPQHDVILRAGTKVIGVKAERVNAFNPALAPPDLETPLELQDQQDGRSIYALGQIFALDGDSIMLAANRNRVVKVQNARGRNRTPLVLGKRELADAEFWTYTNGFGTRPTGGFVRVSQVNDFDIGFQALHDFVIAVQNASWGTVIEIDPNVVMYLTNMAPLHIPAGVTIRGDRRGSRPGPLLSAAYNVTNQQPSPYFPDSDGGMLFINGNYVRITGLRMVGPGRDIQPGLPYANAIATQDQFVSIIDHNEMSDWTAAAVYVGSEKVKDTSDPRSSRPNNVRVVRNFIHHNNKWGDGYGVVTYDGYPYVEGNTFISNRHAIAASHSPFTAYRAWFNLVLSSAPDYGDLFRFGHHYQQDFDVHGTYQDGCDQCGGPAGEYAEIARNTFLGQNRPNFDLRGNPTYPCTFHDNVSLLPYNDAIRNQSGAGGLIVTNNRFNVSNPTGRLGVGDFDGDGIQDLFLATGAAWYYAPAGKEWRYLNAQTDGIDNLLFGDFDGDGRTDVFTQHDYNWEVSWGGASRWETINGSGRALGNFAVGNFVGDRRDDIFYADGSHWYASDAGTSQFIALDVATSRVADLRFGDFNADGKTDVLGVVNGYWRVAYSGTSGWQPLRSKLSDSVSSLLVADFNGDGRADVAMPALISSLGSYTGWTYQVSYNGTGDWVPLRT